MCVRRFPSGCRAMSASSCKGISLATAPTVTLPHSRGEMVAYFEHKVLRTDRLDETGYEVEGISVQPTPILRYYCEKLVRVLNYSGVGCVQFLVDMERGALYFFEINPRLDTTCILLSRCGYDFPELALACAACLDRVMASTGSVPATYPVGKRVHWLRSKHRMRAHPFCGIL